MARNKWPMHISELLGHGSGLAITDYGHCTINTESNFLGLLLGSLGDEELSSFINTEFSLASPWYSLPAPSVHITI